MSIVERLEALLAGGTDNAVLRFTLGNAYGETGAFEPSLAHYRRSLELDPSYSAAWKAYAGTLARSGRPAQAIDAYRRGIDVAQSNGDVQAAKEMRVFVRRLQREE